MIRPKPFDYARKSIVECMADDSIRIVARVFQDENIGSALVKDERGEYIGMLTDSIIFNAISDDVDVRRMRVRELKLMPLFKVWKGASLDDVMEVFNRNKVSRIAMTDGSGKIVAVLKRKNLDRFSSFSMASTLSQFQK